MNAQPSDLDRLGGQLVELRELIREAHGAAKDLRAVIKEARQVGPSLARECEQAARDAASAEIQQFNTRLQADMDRAARDLNRAVDAARRQVLAQLTVTSLSLDETGVRAEFAGNLFDSGDLT